MKIIKQILLASILLIAIISCNKKDAAKPVSTPLTFTSLSAADSTIINGGNTTITATAIGEGITYNWAVDIGNLIGSGHQIIYNACCTGQYNITCVVKDAGNNSQTKSIMITVK